MVNDLPNGLMLIHGNRAEILRDLVIQWIGSHPLAPLEQEHILVQGNAIAQWLKLALASDPHDPDGGGCGIAAAMTFSLPSRFLWQVYRAVLGDSAVPETSPFDKSRLVWILMRLLPELLDQPEYAPLRCFLTNDADLRKRFQLSERLADLFDQYQVYRADWLDDWSCGRDVVRDAHGEARDLAETQCWQPALWRALLADVGATDGQNAVQSSRSAVHSAFMERVTHLPVNERPTGLPERLLVFGISSMPRQSLEVLSVLAKWSLVLVCVHNPCEHFWADIVSDRELLRPPSARQRRRNDRTDEIAEEDLHLYAHPLLAAWGRQGRDFIALLDEHDSLEARSRYVPLLASLGKRIDLFEPQGDDTLLHQLQDDIRDLRPLKETQAKWPAVEFSRDHSICFHIVHSPQREVEVLHDQLLAAFQADRKLRPQDVIVMVPDILAYAPHIQAVFGLLDRDDPRHIPYSLADQGKRQIDPLVHALELLLELPQSRLAASDVLDLLDVPALRRRFDIEEDDLPLLHRWIRGAGVRWGLNDTHRISFDLPEAGTPAAQNTWLFGLRRMLLGYASGGKALAWHDIEPYDEIGGLNAALLGPLLRLLDQLETTWTTLGQPAPVDVWAHRLHELMGDFFAAESDTEAVTLFELEKSLQDWNDICTEAQLTEELPLSVVAEHWLYQLDQNGLAQRFFAGSVTFATLMPMRAIPFRHVCLLGMNDGAYPRTRIPMDFDLMSRDYRPGDRSRREDDRYLFLEALLSARDRLYISWVGRSINDNSVRPPSVLVGQLRDHLASGWACKSFAANTPDLHEKFLKLLTTEHHLQAFNEAYFLNGSDAELFTYAKEWRAAHMKMAPENSPVERLPSIQRDEPLKLNELANFLKDPVKSFFNQRLEVYFNDQDPSSEDIEPFKLDALELWSLREELIDAQLLALRQGVDLADARQNARKAIMRRGELPMGAFGEDVASNLEEGMDKLFIRYLDELKHWNTPMEGSLEINFAVNIDDKTVELADWLNDIRYCTAGERGRVVIEASNLVKNGQYRIDTLAKHWGMHLAAHADGQPTTTVVLSRVGDLSFPPLDVAKAQAQLATLLRAWHEGMRSPLPFAIKTASEWLSSWPVDANQDNSDDALWKRAQQQARKQYEGDDFNKGERDWSRYLQRAWPSFDQLFDGGFADWAETLLRPLKQVITEQKTNKSKPKATDKEAGS